MRLPNGARTERLHALELGVVGAVAHGTAQRHLSAEHDARLGERSGDVVEVADVGHGAPGERTVHLLHGEHVGERLQRVRVVAEHVHHRHRAHHRHAHHHLVAEHASAQHAVVAGHHAGDVLHRLAHVEAHLLTARVHGVTAELHHRHLHRLAGAVRRLLEDECDALTLQGTGQLLALRQVEHQRELVGGEVGDVEEVAGHASTSASEAPRMLIASSISADVTVSGGARRNAVPVTALVTRPRPSAAV